MTEPKTYPQGVTCWIDTEQPDPGAASQFYGGLFGWTLTDATPPDAPRHYLIATLNGQDVAAIGQSSDTTATWNTYIAVDDADRSATEIRAAGGTLLFEPHDVGPAGRTAMARDPVGAEFWVWQARHRLGAQLVNAPGAWNFSDLHTPDRDAATRFYGAVFGWLVVDLDQDAGTMIQVPGYGDHLAATVDPGIRERQASAPAGFADVIGGLVVVGPDEPAHWQVTFTVADRDESAATGEKLGAQVVASSDGPWTKQALLRDPQGAEFSVSQFTPPDGNW